MATEYSSIVRLRWEVSDFKASLGYTASAHSSAPSLGLAKTRYSFQYSNRQKGRRKQAPGAAPQALFSKSPVMLKAVLSTNDLSKLWLPTLGFKDSFGKKKKKNVKLQKISGLSVTFLSAPSLYGHPPDRPICWNYSAQTCAHSLRNNMARGKKYNQVPRLP